MGQVAHIAHGTCQLARARIAPLRVAGARAATYILPDNAPIEHTQARRHSAIARATRIDQISIPQSE